MVHRQASELVETSEISTLILARALLTPAPQGSPKAETWAKVAAKGKARGAAPEEARTNASNTWAHLESHTTQAISESPASDERVVMIRGCKIGTGTSDITRHISEGPLLSISLCYDPVRPSVVAGIVFLEAEHARAFLQRNDKIAEENGHSLFGAGVIVELGPPWSMDNDLQAMVGVSGLGCERHHRICERRRLIFSGAGLFHRVDSTTFHADLAAIVGDDKIELIWLYNRGSATVVFTDTRSARAVQKKLKERALNGEWSEGVSIKFGIDPCEKALNLVTSVPEIAAVKMQ